MLPFCYGLALFWAIERVLSEKEKGVVRVTTTPEKDEAVFIIHIGTEPPKSPAFLPKSPEPSQPRVQMPPPASTKREMLESPSALRDYLKTTGWHVIASGAKQSPTRRIEIVSSPAEVEGRDASYLPRRKMCTTRSSTKPGICILTRPFAVAQEPVSRMPPGAAGFHISTSKSPSCRRRSFR